MNGVRGESRFYCNLGNIIVFMNKIAGLAAALVLSATAFVAGDRAEAQTWPTFQLDLAASSIDVQTRGCAFSCAGFTGSFGSGAENFSWTPAAADEQIVVEDFFNWETTGNRRFSNERYNVSTELVFSTPDVQSTSANGRGLVVRLWGDYSAGVLRWTEAASVTFDQGSSLDIAFEGISNLWRGSISTAATFIGNLIQPTAGSGGSTSAVPLPGSLILLLSAFGLLGGSRVLRRRADLGGAAA